jgi:S-adenosylmethionine:tRNA ribosyltransferase-isomerase
LQREMINTEIKIEDFDYILPDEKIARFPLKNRDSSKLLIYEKGRIHENYFRNIPDFFSSGDLLVFNNTRVIQARMLFTKPAGARVEIFCLEPVDPPDYQRSLVNNRQVTWKCLVGNARRWKNEKLEKQFDYQGHKTVLYAEKVERHDETWNIRFSWKPDDLMFAGILDIAGLVPIPPYLRREPVTEDKTTYQTVYSSIDGSVAAPTAGFHFTQEILGKLKAKGVSFTELTLHVGAGTFRPVLATNINKHIMHSEHIYFNKSNIRDLLDHKNMITTVGTTSTRTLETLYWIGCKIKCDPDINPEKLNLEQWEDKIISPLDESESLETLLEYSERTSLDEFHVVTRMMIIPGYKYHLTDRIITNFHQPRSTLLLMISALIGDDWKKVYEYALNNNFRFLSYGDSSLLIPLKPHVFS